MITEGREGGTAGIFRSDGDMRTGLIDEIAHEVAVDDVLFEAPTKDSQAWFVKHFGPNVNLGNIPPDEVIPLETLRLGPPRGHAQGDPGRRGPRRVSGGQTGFTIWLTGLSGSGKTTVGHLVAAELERRGLVVDVLDGDVVRTHLSQGLGFSKEDRDTNIARIGWVASRLSRAGAAVVVAAISPYAEARARARDADRGARRVRGGARRHRHRGVRAPRSERALREGAHRRAP